MLVFARRSHESIVIGGGNGFERLLKVMVIDVRNGTVKLGIDVDLDVPVHRGETWERNGGAGHLTREGIGIARSAT